MDQLYSFTISTALSSCSNISHVLSPFFSTVGFLRAGRNVSAGRRWPPGRTLRTDALKDTILSIRFTLKIRRRPVRFGYGSVCLPFVTHYKPVG